MGQQHARPAHSLILTVPHRLRVEWGLRDGDRVPIDFGSLHGEAVLHEADREEGVALRWNGGRLVFGGRHLAARITHAPTGVRIAPVIGILTTGVRNDPKKAIGGRTALLGDFVRAARELNVLCYVFNASEVNRSRRTVRGATLVGPPGEQVWKMFTFPLPDVVYNRVPHRKAEVSADVVYAKSRFRAENIPLFNERFLSKREMYPWLLGDARTRDLIPATSRLQSAEGLERFCREHGLVFLKPTGGSLGMGIYKVQRRNGGGYDVRWRRQGKHVTHFFPSAEGLHRFLKSYNPRSTYMMQQGIRLKPYRGRVTDFRVHLHKDGSGRWEAAGIGGKVAGQGAVTTHVHNGGRVYAGDTLLDEWYGAEADVVRRRLIEASVRIAEVVEEQMKRPVGELGLDVGIDEQGRIWTFEANAKPGRAIFRHPDLREAGRRSAALTVEYAAHLCGEPLRKEERDETEGHHTHRGAGSGLA